MSIRPASLVKIGEAARILGVHPNTLRRWEEQGLIKPVARTRGVGTRYYHVDQLLEQVGKEEGGDEGQYITMDQISALVGGDVSRLNIGWGTGPAYYSKASVMNSIDEIKALWLASQDG